MVLLLALDRLARLHVEARASSDDLDVYEYLQTSVVHLALDARTLPSSFT